MEIVKKDIPEDQVKRLMDRHLALLLNGIVTGKAGEVAGDK
jgi:hypothetical protein